MLPKPDCTFTIPSLHDGLELDGRLYFPRQALLGGTALPIQAFAIMAHPYAPLGGYWDDPVVQAVSSKLLRLGFVVSTFNFRGAMGSAGSTSWTGNAELADYVSMLAHMLFFINAPEIMDHVQSRLLVLGGYSYGSMLCSCLPNLESFRHYIARESANEFMKEIQSRAVKLSQSLLGFVEGRGHSSRDRLQLEQHPASPRGVVMGGYTSEATGQHIRHESSRRSIDAGSVRRSIDKIKHRFSTSERESEAILPEEPPMEILTLPRIAFLLVSPILPPIAGFITLFSRPSFDCGQKSDKQTKDQQEENLSRNSALVLCGANDVFTSASKLKKWAQGIGARPDSKFEFREINEAGHFWKEPEMQQVLTDVIAEWCTRLL